MKDTIRKILNITSLQNLQEEFALMNWPNQESCSCNLANV